MIRTDDRRWISSSKTSIKERKVKRSFGPDNFVCFFGRLTVDLLQFLEGSLILKFFYIL